MVNPIGPIQPLWPPAKAQPGVQTQSDMRDALLGQLPQAESGGDPLSGSSSTSLDLSGFGGDLQAVDPSVASAIAGVQTGDTSGTAAVPTDLAQAALVAYMNAAQTDSQPSEDTSPGIDLFG